MESLITVLVPVFNGAPFLNETLECLLRQTEKRIQILCIDDGSTDGSAEIIQAHTDPRIILLRQENRGLCETLNRGLALVKTPYVARNDQDDLSDLHRLENQLAHAQAHPDVACIFTNYQKVGRAKRWKNLDKQSMTVGSFAEFKGLQNGCQLGSTMLARTKYLRDIGGFRQEYYPADDWDMELRLVERFPIHILLEPLVTYRFHFGANTYRTFSTMQIKSRWAEDSHRRRVRGEPELDFSTFQKLDRGAIRNRLQRAAREFAALQLRIAGQHYLDGQFFRAALRGTISATVNPMEIINRARRLIKGRSQK